MAKNMVTIPLEEYKELLLKEKPTDRDKEMLSRILELIGQNIVYSESTYYSSYIGDHMKVSDEEKTIKEIMTMLKYVDIDEYMKIWNKVQTHERKRKEQEEKIQQMNEAKEIRNGVNE